MTITLQKRLLDVLGTLYETARNGTPETWLAVYEEIAAILSSGPGGLSVFLSRTKNFEIVAANIDAASLNEYTDYFQFVSPFRDTITKLKPGEYFSRTEHCSDELFERTELYQDYLRKLGIYQYEYHALCNMPGATAGISFSRPRDRRRFTADERKAIDFLIPHVRRAFQVHFSLFEAKCENRQMVETLGFIPQRVIVVDGSAKVLFLNPAADEIIAEKDGLEINRHILSASAPEDNRAFRMALAAVSGRSADSLPGPGGVMRLSRPSGMRSLQILIAPFCEMDPAAYTSEPRAIIFVYDPERNIETVESVLSTMYGLTPAESRLAAIIAKGESLKSAGELLNIQPNTTRTHLKRIFSKTETRRQGELVTLIHNGPANLRNLRRRQKKT